LTSPLAHDKSGFRCQVWSRPCHDQDTQEEGNQRRVGFLDIFSEEQDPAPKNWTGGIDGIGSFCFWRVGMGMFLE